MESSFELPKSHEVDLLNSIRCAFEKRSRPSILTNSKELSDVELSDLRAIGNLKWDEVSSAEWERRFDAIHWFSPEAFCYYLPGIYKISIEENDPNLIVVGSVVAMLDRSPTREWWDDFFVERWTLLSEGECKATQDWLWWLSSFSDSQFSEDSLMRALQTIEMLILK